MLITLGMMHCMWTQCIHVSLNTSSCIFSVFMHMYTCIPIHPCDCSVYANLLPPNGSNALFNYTRAHNFCLLTYYAHYCILILSLQVYHQKGHKKSRKVQVYPAVRHKGSHGQILHFTVLSKGLDQGKKVAFLSA